MNFINQEIRKLGYKGLIIGVTGNALKVDVDTFMTHGADKVLIKPMNIDDLKGILAEGVRSNWAEDDEIQGATRASAS